MAVKVQYEKENGKIYAGNVLSSGEFGSYYSEVTEQCLLAAVQYILDMKMTGDHKEEMEFTNPFYKHGLKPYRISITLTPVD